MMQNILFVGPNFKRRKGGIASVLDQYSQYLGHNFRFYPSAYFQSTALNFLTLPLALIGFGFYLAIHRNIRIVHIHGSSKGSFYRKYFFFLVAKHLFSKKILYHVHGSEYHLFYKDSPAWIQGRVKSMVDGVDGLIVLSKEWKAYFTEHFGQNRIVILNNIVPYKGYNEKKIGDKVNFVFLGRLGDRKGIFDVLRAIKKNIDEFTGRMHLYVGGDGELSRFEQYVDRHELSELVTYLGWISGTQKSELLESSHISILPSHNEGLPITLLEAMSFGMPLVASHAGGISNILTHLENGYVVEPSNLQSIADGIRYYIGNPEKIMEQGKCSYKRVVDFFPEAVFRDLNNIYQEIL